MMLPIFSILYLHRSNFTVNRSDDHFYDDLNVSARTHSVVKRLVYIRTQDSADLDSYQDEVVRLSAVTTTKSADLSYANTAHANISSEGKFAT